MKQVLLTGVVAMAISTSALADHQALHAHPQGPAKSLFASDLPRMTDSEWGFRMGGFGGIVAFRERNHVPVIFVRWGFSWPHESEGAQATVDDVASLRELLLTPTE